MNHIKEFWDNNAREFGNHHRASWGDYHCIALEIDTITKLIKEYYEKSFVYLKPKPVGGISRKFRNLADANKNHRPWHVRLNPNPVSRRSKPLCGAFFM